MEAAARVSLVMVETASAATGDGGQRSAVLRLGRWPVAEAEEMSMAEAASAMAEAAAVMRVSAAVAVVGRRSGQDEVVSRHGSVSSNPCCQFVRPPPPSHTSNVLPTYMYVFNVRGWGVVVAALEA